MRVRSALALGCVIALTTGAAAVAAPGNKKLCNLIVDEANDNVLRAGPAYDPSLDVVSADVATDAENVTVVIRVVKMTATSDLAPTGRYYEMTWRYQSNGVGSGPVSAALTPTGDVWVGGGGTGVMDLDKNEIRITMPISRLLGHPKMGAGEVLEGIRVATDVSSPSHPPIGDSSQANIGLSFNYLGDVAETDKVYPVRARSCVRVGK